MPPDHPLSRLARYDHTGFHPVGPGELGVPVVHVFVHGWQPGYLLRERLLATADQVPALPAWDPRLVDVTGRALIEDYTDLLDALARLGTDHVVLWYSWLDESATEADVFQAFRSRQATQVNGRRLALALHQALGGRRARLHLIGHSHGSAVVAHAATGLARRPDQLTLLDAPEDPISRAGGASDLIAAVLPRLRPGRAPHQTFVDSYASAFGRPYHRRSGLSEVVDVQLTAPLTLSRDPVRAINAAHLYPVQWYARSVRERDQGVGYGWSPLAGADPTGLHSWYYSALPQRPMRLTRHVGDPLTRFAEQVAVRASDRLADLVADRPNPLAERRRPRQRPRPRRRPVPEVALRVSGDGAAAQLVTTEPGDELVEFDLRVHGCTGSELIEIDLDGAPAFVAAAGQRVPRCGRYLLLADGRPGEHLVTLRVSGATGGAASGPRVELADLHLVRGRRPAPGFTLGRSAGVIFGSGVATGAGATLLGGLAVRQVWHGLRAGRRGR